MKVVGPGGAHRIAVLTNDEAVLPEIQEWLASSFHTTLLNSWDELHDLLQAVQIAAVVADIETAAESSENCLKLLHDLRNISPDLVLVGLTRSRSKALSAQARTAGLDKLFVAPVVFQELQLFLMEALESRDLEIQNRALREEASNRSSFCDLIGGSEAMRVVYEAISNIADSNATVLVRGESGTGKELVARAIVATGSRRDEAFVSVNCAALPETLIEAELFGHEKGAFTGADVARPGYIELAQDGTLFLDEIGTLGLVLQSKLLRVLEQRTVQRIGAKASKKIDFRLITATNEDLENAVNTGRFREDLYYRINVVPIMLPPLRERPTDIPLLIDHFLRLYCVANNIQLKQVEPEALEVMEEYSWPGNVRELENLMQRLVLMAPGPVIKVKNLPQQVLYDSTAKQESFLIPEEGISFDEEIAKIEVAYIRASLRRTENNKTAAAKLLGIDRQKMKYLCRKYRIVDSG
ncbi:MAG: sigma-54 interaction domain-containing protein [Terriglobales bacterium]